MRTFKKLGKQLILHGIECVGLNRLARHHTRRRLLGLCYHGVLSTECPENDARLNLAVTASQFERQMRELRLNWNPVSVEQIRQSIEEGVLLPDRAVLVSFDDGYRNNFTVAVPILEKYQIPAIVFITTDMIGTGKLVWAVELIDRLVSWEQSQFTLGGTKYALPPPNTPERTWAVMAMMGAIRSLSSQELQPFKERIWSETTLDLSPNWKKELYEFMNWDEVRQLQKKGIAVGAHTVTHPVLSKLEPAELERELSESKQHIEQELGGLIDTLAYPFGSRYDYSDAVIDKARELGYKIGFTLTERRNHEVLESMRIDRICISNDLSFASFRALISGIRSN